MAFLGGLALLGSAGENYQKFRGKQQALDDADIDQAASVALGRGMQGLAQIGGGPTPPGGPAGGAPGGSPQPPPGAAGPQAGAMPQPQPPVQFGPPGGPGGGQPPAPMGGLTGGLVGGGGGQPPAGGGQPVQPMSMGPQGGGMPPGGGGQPQGGLMDLPTLAGIIQRGNPGIKPEVFARALKQGSTLLTPFANQQLRQMLMQNQLQRIQAAHPGYEQFQEWLASDEGQKATPEQVGDAWNRFSGKQQMEQQKEQGRSGLEAQRQGGKVQLETQREEGRSKLEGQRQEGRMTIEKAKEESRAALAKNKELADLEKQRRQMENNVTKNNVAMYRANLDKQHKIIQTEINARAAGLSAAEAKKLKDEEEKRYDEEVKSLKALMDRNKTTVSEDADKPSSFEDRFGGR
jgi:hypothetical protein